MAIYVQKYLRSKIFTFKNIYVQKIKVFRQMQGRHSRQDLAQYIYEN